MRYQGGATLVAKLLGEQKKEQACQAFALFVHSTLISGAILALLGQIVLEPVVRLLGATGTTFDYSVLYGRISLLSLPFFMLQYCFQPFFVTAERPNLGLIVTVVAGSANIILDALLIIVVPWGLTGAAIATSMSEVLGALIPFCYFKRNTTNLCLTKASWSLRLLVKGCGNGFSEFLTNVAAPLLTGLYNFQLYRLIGEDGVAALGVILYVSFVFSTLFLGYAIGSSPLVSYNLGAKAFGELRNIFSKSVLLTLAAGISLTFIAYFSAEQLAVIFIGYDANLVQLTRDALRSYAPVFMMLGLNIYGGSFFTALNNGVASAVISLLRTIVFGCLFLFILPIFLGLQGVWLAFSLTEFATLIVTIALIVFCRKEYQYI